MAVSTELFTETNKFRQYRYHVVNIQFVIPGGKVLTIPPERMVGFTLIHDYEKAILPIFKVSIALESSVYYKIIKKKNKGYLYLRIDTYFTIPDSSKKSIYKPYINGNFQIIMDESTDDMLAAQKAKAAKANFKKKEIKDTENLKDSENAILNAYLFNIDTVNCLKTNVGSVLANATITDAIGYCLMKAGFTKNVIMAKVENNKKYGELFIPRISFLKVLLFLDLYYGLYKTGSIFYFGLNYSYIIPYDGKCHAWVKKNKCVISVLVPDSSGNHLSSSGELVVKDKDATKNDKINYVVGDYHTINIANESISNNYTNANDIYSVDDFDGKIKKKKSKAKKRDKNFQRTYENSTENDFITDMYAAQSKAKSVVVRVNVNNCDIRNLEPNRRYKLVFEDANYAKKYSGNYILLRVDTEFLKDGIDFTTDIKLKMLQCPKTKKSKKKNIKSGESSKQKNKDISTDETDDAFDNN